MGYAIDALSDGLVNIIENPMILVVAYVLAVAMIPVFVILALVGLVMWFVPLIGPIAISAMEAAIVKPLVFGGLLGVAAAGFAGSVAFADYVETLREKYLTLAGAFLLYEVIVFAVSMVLSTLLVVVLFLTIGFSTLAATSTEDPTAATAGTSLTVLLVLLIVLGAVLVITAIAVVFQFIDVAIVLGDQRALDAYGESWRLVREAPLSVLGYTVLRVLLGLVIGLPAWLALVAGFWVSDTLVLAAVALWFLLSPLSLAVLMSYHAAYYNRRVQLA